MEKGKDKKKIAIDIPASYTEEELKNIQTKLNDIDNQLEKLNKKRSWL